MTKTDQVNRELEELLPAYVNGTLSSEQQAVVEAYLSNLYEARGEVIWLRALHRRMYALPTSNSPGEIGWQRLRRSLQLEGRGNSRLRTNWWKPVMAAAALIIALQATILIDSRPGEDSFQPLRTDIRGAHHPGVIPSFGE